MTFVECLPRLVYNTLNRENRNVFKSNFAKTFMKLTKQNVKD